MKIALISLTDRGFHTARRIAASFPCRYTLYLHEKGLSGLNSQPVAGREIRVFRYLREIMPVLWQEYSVLIFIMATGIVVRQLAPWIKSKAEDPAVLVLDEEGHFVIPLLSGHLGGANAWARQIARHISAEPVITTATDVRGLTAPDEYARRFGWKVEPLQNLPSLNRRFLEQGYLTVWSEHSLNPDHPLLKDQNYIFLSDDGRDKADFIISVFPQEGTSRVHLIPPVLSLGIGCRRGIAAEVILQGITEALGSIGASPLGIKGIYSIELKADEEGLIEASRQLKVPLETFTPKRLQELNNQQNLTKSDFVKQKIGVDGVCEPASLLGTQNGNLILPKYKAKGVTIAISQEKFLSWESGPEIPSI